MVVPYFDNSEIKLNQKMIRDNKIVIKEKGWFSKSGRKTDVIIHIKKQNKDGYTKFLGILLAIAAFSCFLLLFI